MRSFPVEYLFVDSNAGSENGLKIVANKLVSFLLVRLSQLPEEEEEKLWWWCFQSNYVLTEVNTTVLISLLTTNVPVSLLGDNKYY